MDSFIEFCEKDSKGCILAKHIASDKAKAPLLGSLWERQYGVKINQNNRDMFFGEDNLDGLKMSFVSLYEVLYCLQKIQELVRFIKQTMLPVETEESNQIILNLVERIIPLEDSTHKETVIPFSNLSNKEQNMIRSIVGERYLSLPSEITVAYERILKLNSNSAYIIVEKQKGEFIPYVYTGFDREAKTGKILPIPISPYSFLEEINEIFTDISIKNQPVSEFNCLVNENNNLNMTRMRDLIVFYSDIIAKTQQKIPIKIDIGLGERLVDYTKNKRLPREDFLQWLKENEGLKLVSYPNGFHLKSNEEQESNSINTLGADIYRSIPVPLRPALNDFIGLRFFAHRSWRDSALHQVSTSLIYQRYNMYPVQTGKSIYLQDKSDIKSLIALSWFARAIPSIVNLMKPIPESVIELWVNPKNSAISLSRTTYTSSKIMIISLLIGGENYQWVLPKS